MNTAVSREAQSGIAVSLLNLVEFKVNLEQKSQERLTGGQIENILKSFVTGEKTFRSMLRMNISTGKRLLLRTS